MDRGIGKTAVALLLLIVGLACLGFLVYSLANDLSIWVLGRHAEAEVMELGVISTNDVEEGELTFDYFVKYRFATPGGQVVVDTVLLDVREWGALTEGGPLDVVYFPLYPQHNRVDESRYVTVLACAYIPLVLLTWGILGAGLYLLRPAQVREWWFSREPKSER
jgi:hypothetical protein